MCVCVRKKIQKLTKMGRKNCNFSEKYEKIDEKTLF